MKIYRWLLVLWGCASVIQGWADPTAQGLIQKLSTQMNGYKAYELRFTATMEGEFTALPGRIVVSGSRYYVQVNDYELFCDGKLLYTYNTQEEEATLETPRPNDPSLLSNPARFFRLSDEDFVMQYRGTATVGGKKVEQVDLTPKQRDAGYRSIRVQVDPTNGWPVSVRYEGEQSAPIEVKITKVTPNVAVTPSTFVFDRKAHKGVEVVDLR
ncbi:MAG: outer membrane lipoprotein carrier protein LolA [Alistipes sp.]|nr:outer membrane lipoprotein carrier protein LolA [Alistipes sp.]